MTLWPYLSLVRQTGSPALNAHDWLRLCHCVWLVRKINDWFILWSSVFYTIYLKLEFIFQTFICYKLKLFKVQIELLLMWGWAIWLQFCTCIYCIYFVLNKQFVKSSFILNPQQPLHPTPPHFILSILVQKLIKGNTWLWNSNIKMIEQWQSVKSVHDRYSHNCEYPFFFFTFWWKYMLYLKLNKRIFCFRWYLICHLKSKIKL